MARAIYLPDVNFGLTGIDYLTPNNLLEVASPTRLECFLCVLGVLAVKMIFLLDINRTFVLK
jgi:hypothetical protein